MSEIVLRREQLIRRPRAEVFEFFARPENLARVTPPGLGFVILSPSPVEMRTGAVIDYSVRPFGFPLRWRTLITAYEPPLRFVDEQARGPYAFWHHTHEFEEVPEGTLVRDTVRYRLPLGGLGRLVAGRLVAADLEGIFRFRREALAKIFPERAVTGGRTMNIVVAGGTGFVGKALVEALIARGDKVVVLSRRVETAAAVWGGKAAAKEWDGKNPGPWVQAVDGADAVINLAGEGVADKRWSAERKLALTKSRIDATRAIVAAMKQAAKKPKLLLNASAVGYYGADAAGDCAEDAPQGRDFLAALCGQWEREAAAAETLGVVVSLLRIGVVLERDGGALAKMLLPFKLGLGGPLGSGKQAFPWIHRDDIVGAILHLLDHPRAGAFNLVAPGAATNAEFSKALGRALGRPAFFAAPGPAVRLLVGEMADMLLGGQRAVPKALLAAGYRFKHPALDDALKAIVG